MLLHNNTSFLLLLEEQKDGLYSSLSLFLFEKFITY